MRNDNKFLFGILFLSFVGFLVSLWLLSVHLRFSSGQAGLTEACSIIPMGDGKGCATIAVSAYSKPLGIPLPAIAMGFYFTLLALIFWSWKNPQACYEPLYFSFFLSTCSVVVTVLMAIIAKTQLHSFCSGCATLWAINLLLWPAFVKQLGLRWGNALSSLSELVSHNKLNLNSGRITKSAVTGLISMIIFCGLGLAAESMQAAQMNFGEADRAIKDYNDGQMMFLAAEMFTGPSVKGANNGQKLVMDIVEFADLQCSACKMAAQAIKPFLLRHGDSVRYSFHHFPLDGSCNGYVPNGMHHSACGASKAAICAGAQGKFFEFHDVMFDRQHELSSELFIETAKALGLDMEKFDSCLKDPQTEAILQKDIEWAQQVKVEFTPTIIINGRKMGGAMGLQQLEALYQHLANETK